MANTSISSNPASKQKRPHNRQTHNKRYTAVYRAYHLAKRRCTNTAGVNYADYGGRGIEFRFTSFEEFYAELGDKPSSNHSVDRIDNDGHYEKGNVRWALRPEQRRNQRRTRYITVRGESRCAAEWATIYNIPLNTITSRKKRNWCDECSVVVPTTGRICCTHKTVGRPRQKLTEEQVKEIREYLALKAFTHPEIAKLYNISIDTVSEIKRRIRWNHI